MVGAGAAGLRCAQVLAAAGITPLVVEASDRVGGRIATDEIDGYLIDRGFQLLNPSYPQARRALDLAELDGQAMVSREEGSNTRRVTHQAMVKAGVRPRIVLELGSREAVCEAVGAGLGFGMVWQTEAQGSTRVRTLALRDVAITSTDHVACLKSERMRRAITAFFQVAAGFSNQRPPETRRGT